MAKLKKSKTKPRSQRSIDEENRRIAAVEAYEKQIARRKEDNKVMGMTVLCLYGLIMAIIAWLIDYMGIVALLSVIVSFIGLRTLKEKSGRNYYACIAGLVLGGLRLITELIPLLSSLGS